MDDLIYLDNAATSFPKPEAVYAFMDRFYRKFGVNPGRSGFDLCVEAGDILEGTRKSLASFFGGRDPNRLIFSYNSTDALNIAINGMLRDGRHAVSTTLEHNSVLRPLWHAQEDRGCEVTYVSFDGAGFLDPDEIAKSIRPDTDLVAVNHGSNVIGTLQPIAEIAGSGMHTHQSLFRGKSNAFDDPDGELGLSRIALSYIAGLLTHARGLSAVTNPLVNSYKRLVPGHEAPTAVVWSERNRSPLIRVPARRGTGARVELRSPDPSCNPYLGH